jgi:hypothetical protein
MEGKGGGVMEAKDILKLIEEVDSTGRSKLDEIDLAVTKYLASGHKFGFLVYPIVNDYHTERIGDMQVVHTTQRAKYQYTRSRAESDKAAGAVVEMRDNE